MKVAGAILKQVKNANKHTMKRRRSSAAMAKSSDCIEGIHFEAHANGHVHNPSTRGNSIDRENMTTINKCSTLPGHYKTS